MRADREKAARLSELRDELLAWNRIEQLRARDEDPPDFQLSSLRHGSLESLLETLATIVGPEDRVNYPDATPAVQAAVDSVALICSGDDLTPPSGQNPTRQLVGKKNCICPKYNFSDEMCVESRKAQSTPGTGFLVGASGKYLLTAGHAVIDNNGNLIKNQVCVFGYRKTGSGMVTSFPDSPTNIVELTNLVAYGKNSDWALVELAASTGRPGLPLRPSGKPSVSDPVIAIGYPHGLPVKTGPGAIRDVSGPEYLTDLDISPGNSGSPVIAVDANGNPVFVEGIATMGNWDLMAVAQNKCSVWLKACDQNDASCFPGFVPIGNVLASSLFVKTVFP